MESLWDNRGGDNYSLFLRPPSPTRLVTTLLFQAAMSLAQSHKSNRVVYICHPDRVQQTPPVLGSDIDSRSNDSDSHGMEEALQRITMRYISSESQLRDCFASLHLHPKLPDAILVDSFSFLSSEEYTPVTDSLSKINAQTVLVDYPYRYRFFKVA